MKAKRQYTPEEKKLIKKSFPIKKGAYYVHSICGLIINPADNWCDACDLPVNAKRSKIPTTGGL